LNSLTRVVIARIPLFFSRKPSALDKRKKEKTGGKKNGRTENCVLPSMRQPKIVQSWDQVHPSRRDTTVSVPRLLL
jgi:hypothetical protein